MARDEWELPEQLQPQQDDCGFDLQSAYHSVVLLRSEVSDSAYTAAILGTERLGHGVIIHSAQRKVILTIGYLITEAESIWLTTYDGEVVEGYPLAHDPVSGFGLVQALGPVDAPSIERGSISSLAVGDPVVVIGHGGARHSLKARLIARREFAGYWEYLLDDALFTAPPHPQWNGAALVGQDGRLLGIGSLFLQESMEQESFDANMFVPIDLLEPVLEDMLTLGRPQRAPRPWLGAYGAEQSDEVIIADVSRDGPAYRAGVRPGDVIAEVAGQPIRTLPQFYRRLWSLGAAGVEVPLTLTRSGKSLRITVHSGNREDFLKKPARH